MPHSPPPLSAMIRPKRNATKISYALPSGDGDFLASDDEGGDDFDVEDEPMEDSDGEGYNPNPKKR